MRAMGSIERRGEGHGIAGGTALMYAAANGHRHVVAVLIAAGADVNRQHDFGESALSLAEKYNNGQVIKQLKNAGAKQ